MNDALDAFEALVRRRRATRHFINEPVDPALVDRLLGITQWAPSGYNLQPTRFIVVTERGVRPELRRACMNQPQIEEAPVVVVFAGDHRAYEDSFDETLGRDIAIGAAPPEYVTILRKLVPLAFQQGPFGLHWAWKAALLPIVRLFQPIPAMPAVDKRAWLAKQVSLSAMTFLLAAEAAGLHTLPMEGFDTSRVRRALNLPGHWEPLIIVPLGHIPPGPPAAKSRLPLDRVLIHR